ncbi:nucleotide-diphospho-sugar transferase [Phyllosticta citrichinensis]|uniref:Nucleotide-diphospho-sugar transferase n=1 Tax=Phyllosticta citrichinensis TaxID=1130410 RepID=A0ABR1XGG5_9PEZI
MATAQEDAYVTLVMSDSYLPGAAVLAHSLRDAGTKKKLAALVTLDTLAADTVGELKELYDYLIPVERIGTPKPANLYLMNRGDLAYTFTKIALWRQLQFRKIVYIDADVVALRAPDELFAIDAPFAAAPDVGWPDAFNTGVMVISPNLGDYWALKTLASSGDSFDGADQGLLNQYYEHKDWHRLSFTYNCTPNAQYQWEPAYRHYKSNIKMVHFIGQSKPWTRNTRQGGGPGVYNELLARWWAVYDKHLQTKTPQFDPTQALQAPNIIQRNVQAEAVRTGDLGAPGPEHPQPVPETGETRPTTEIPFTDAGDLAETITNPEPPPQPQFSAPHVEWDATRSAPPAISKPEAANLPSETYTFSENRELFQPPASYPEPPRDMYYELPKSKPKTQDAPKPIFPWEQERERPKPSRVFVEDSLPPQASPAAQAEEQEFSKGLANVQSPEHSSSSSSGSPPLVEDPWQAFGQNLNAWDSVPGIDKYVRSVMGTQGRRSKPTSISLAGLGQPPEIMSPIGARPGGRRESLILTDFPSAVERPSLPVTPAAVRRPTFWGGERDEAGDLPPAEGVPNQAEWDPQERLEHLRRLSLLELEHLKQSATSPNSAPLRQLPEHSVSTTEEMTSPPADSTAEVSQETEIEKKEKLGQQKSVAPVQPVQYAPRPPAITADSETEMSNEQSKPALQVPDFGNTKVEQSAGEQSKGDDKEETVLSPSQRP